MDEYVFDEYPSLEVDATEYLSADYNNNEQAKEIELDNNGFESETLSSNTASSESAMTLPFEKVSIFPVRHGSFASTKEKSVPMTKTEKILSLYALAWSLAFLVAAPIGMLLSGETSSFLANFLLIITTPSKLITDYFNIGGLGSALFNAAICGLSCNFLIFITKTKFNATVLASYFLVVAHCFYGLNIINMWSPFIGVAVYCLVSRKKFRNNIHIAMFSTSLGPFVSEFLFRYTIPDTFTFGTPQITALGVVLAIVFGLVSGFVIPALLPGTTKMHRGFNLYKAGLAIGLFGTFAYALMYKNFGLTSPDIIWRDNPTYVANELSYEEFMDIFFAIIFVATLLAGFFLNGKSFKDYNKLLGTDGHEDNFPEQFGMALTLINIGCYGLFVLLYLNTIFILTDGAGFTGPTAGVTIAAITFSAAGQHPKNVWPIVVGYILHFGLTYLISALAKIPMTWTLSSQGYINGLAFATGLCPFAGKYGIKVGILAGLICALICTSTSLMHGGYVLYNGGFSAGLTALILIPMLDFYNIKVKHGDKYPTLKK